MARLSKCTHECSIGCRASTREIQYTEDERTGRWYAWIAHDTPPTEGFYGTWSQTVAEGRSRIEVAAVVRSMQEAT